MSQGAIFKLVLRDERYDKFFTASDYLRQRLDAIREQRKAAGLANVQPTFADIERSHILHIHAAYRPFVVVASEYSRVKASGDGTAFLGPSNGSVVFTFPIHGHFTSDLVVHVRIREIGSRSAFEAEDAPTDAVPLLRYCAYPGLRMFRKFELKSDQMLIDDYDTDDAVHYSKFFVHADYRDGWDRAHGQQVERRAAYDSNGYTGTLSYSDGPQTMKLYHEPLDMYVPLQFWLCHDADQALLNDLIPNTQRTVTCDLAQISQIIQALVPDPRNPGEYMQVPLPFTKLAIEMELYVNGLYVNPEIHDIFASRLGYSLLRVHRRQTNFIQSPSDAFLLDQLKFPAEYLMVGFRDRRNRDNFDSWWLMGTPAQRGLKSRLMVPTYVWNAGLMQYQLVVREARDVSTLENFVGFIGVTAHGTEIFPLLPSLFYNAYLPTRYAKNSMIISPADASEFMVTFCIYPGQFNPSGYYNLSAGRELYLNYALKPSHLSTVLDHSEIVIAMSALNFLIRKGDRLSLAYTL